MIKLPMDFTGHENRPPTSWTIVYMGSRTDKTWKRDNVMIEYADYIFEMTKIKEVMVEYYVHTGNITTAVHDDIWSIIKSNNYILNQTKEEMLQLWFDRSKSCEFMLEKLVEKGVEMIECKGCKKELAENWFRPETNGECVICFSKHGEVKLEAAQKSKDFEEVEDKSCAGGACTL